MIKSASFRNFKSLRNVDLERLSSMSSIQKKPGSPGPTRAA